MIRNIVFVFICLVAFNAIAQSARNVKGAPPTAHQQAKKKETKIKWITFQEAQELQKVTKKKIFVDVYTDWCGWCKRMDAATFSNTNIINYVNDTYYAVKFNAEQKEPIEWNGKVYKYTGTGGRGTHEFASYLLNNRLSYPTTVFLDEDLNLIQPLPGFMDADKLEPILHYFGADNHKKVSWDQFQQDWKKSK